MSYTVVFPYIVPSIARPCRESWAFPAKNVLEVDNSVDNIGIMRSHNLGINRMYADRTDWLVVLSAALRFGRRGGLDFIRALDERPDHHVVEAAGVYGWHLIAFHRRVIDAVGRWDENFTPYGFDDIDMSLRIYKAFPERQWEKVPVNCVDIGMAHSVKDGGVRADVNAQIDYFIAKWGRHPGASEIPTFETPFDDDLPLSYWPEYTP